MPYTKQDVLDKIEDISTNLHSCFTALTAKGVTVPADASLDDLGGLIRQIPDASHPDYELPWVMTDGSTCVWLPTTMGKARSFAIECELAPTGQSSSSSWVDLLRASASNLSSIGIMYHDASVQASRKLTKSVGQSGQTADVDNNARVSWTGWPFYKKQTIACSFLSTSGYRSSLQYNGSWTHAGTSSAQQSSSGLNDVMVCLFSQARYSNTGLSSPYTSSNCPAGTKVYGINRWSTLYSDITTATETKICLHWDPLNKEYRPCFRYDNANNYEYSSFPKTAKNNQDGTLYYLDVTKGLTEKTGYSSGTRHAYTDIPNSSAYSYVLKVYSTRRNGGSAVDYITAYDTSDGYTMRIGNSIGSAYMKFQKNESYGGTNYATDTGAPGQSGNFIIGVDFANNSMFYTTDSLTSGKANYTIAKPSVSDDVRGKICIVKPHSTTYSDALYSVMIYEGSALIHYLVYCNMPGKTYGVFYDCVTKKTYDIE